jgi:hypothetical protein
MNLITLNPEAEISVLNGTTLLTNLQFATEAYSAGQLSGILLIHSARA